MSLIQISINPLCSSSEKLYFSLTQDSNICPLQILDALCLDSLKIRKKFVLERYFIILLE